MVEMRWMVDRGMLLKKHTLKKGRVQGFFLAN